VTHWPATLERLRDTVGLWTTVTEGLEPQKSQELAVEIESLDYSALWIPEAWGREALSNASMLLSATSSLTVATGIANIWARDAVSAMNAGKTLTALSHERFVLGLGVSHQPLVERMRGHHYERPLAAMANYLAAMDAAPMFAPESAARVPRVIAALGPQMLELARGACDGAHTYLVTPEHTSSARAILKDKFLAVEQALVLGQSREEFLSRAHAHLEIYTGLANYRASWRRLGFSDEDFVRGGSERLCDAMVLHGDEDAVLERVQAHRQAGANHVCLQVLGDDLSSVPLDEWRRVSVALAP